MIVTHAATKIALASALLGLSSVFDYIDDKQTLIRAGSCSLSKFIKSNNDDSNKWKIVMNGNCEFLTKGEEMNWDFRQGVEAGSAEDIARRKAIDQALAEQQQQQQQNKPKRMHQLLTWPLDQKLMEMKRNLKYVRALSDILTKT